MILFFKAQIANQPGLALETVTDRDGHTVRRWKRAVEQWKAIKPVAPFQREAPTSGRAARRPNYAAEETAHHADSDRHAAEVKAVAHGLLHQDDAAELHARTRGVRASELDQGDLSHEEELLYAMNDHDAKRDWRPEAHQDQEANVDGDYLGRGALMEAIKDTKDNLKDYKNERKKAEKALDCWVALAEKMHSEKLSAVVPEDAGVGIEDDSQEYTLDEVKRVVTGLYDEAETSDEERNAQEVLAKYTAALKKLDSRQKARARG